MDIIPFERISNFNTVGEQLLYSSQYKYVDDRLNTFTNWLKHDIVSPQSLAEAGFYYTQCRDSVKCAFCQLGVRNWEEGDTAIGEHRRFSPHCPHLMSLESEPTAKSCKVCLTSDMEILFFPCLHLMCCQQCSSRITSCPLCRRHIFSSLKIFVA